MMQLRSLIIGLIILTFTSIGSVNSMLPKRTHEQAFGAEEAASSSPTHVSKPQDNDSWMFEDDILDKWLEGTDQGMEPNPQMSASTAVEEAAQQQEYDQVPATFKSGQTSISGGATTNVHSGEPSEQAAAYHYQQRHISHVPPKLSLGQPSSGRSVMINADAGHNTGGNPREQNAAYQQQPGIYQMPTNFNFGQPSNSGGGATAYADAGQGGTSIENNIYLLMRSEIRLERGITKSLTIKETYEHYRWYILWLEHLLLFYQEQIRINMASKGKTHAKVFWHYINNAVGNHQIEQLPGEMFEIPDVIGTKREKKKQRFVEHLEKGNAGYADNIQRCLEKKDARESLLDMLPKLELRKMIKAKEYALLAAHKYKTILTTEYLADYKSDWAVPKDTDYKQIIKQTVLQNEEVVHIPVSSFTQTIQNLQQNAPIPSSYPIVPNQAASMQPSQHQIHQRIAPQHASSSSHPPLHQLPRNFVSQNASSSHMPQTQGRQTTMPQHSWSHPWHQLGQQRNGPQYASSSQLQIQQDQQQWPSASGANIPQNTVPSDYQPGFVIPSGWKREEKVTKSIELMRGEIREEMGITKKSLTIKETYEHYRWYILWLEHLLLIHQDQIRIKINAKGRAHVKVFLHYINNAIGNHQIEQMPKEMLELTPEQKANHSMIQNMEEHLKNKANKNAKKTQLRIDLKELEAAFLEILPKLEMRKILKMDEVNLVAARNYKMTLTTEYLAEYRSEWAVIPKYSEYRKIILDSVMPNEQHIPAFSRSHPIQNVQNLETIPFYYRNNPTHIVLKIHEFKFQQN